MMPIKISHSRVELYNTCAYKFKLKYIDRLEVNKTFSPLLFGSACDQAFNYLLIQTKNKNPIDQSEAVRIFNGEMDKWDGTTEFVFFKSEIPEDHYDENDPEGNQRRAFNYLRQLGPLMIATYVEEILDLFEEIVDVQITKTIKNELGDELILVMDFIAKLKTGETLVVDNKTTGDLKRNYPKTAVAKSQQLSIYAEFTDNREAAYLVLSKRLKDDKIQWKFIKDSIPEEMTAAAFDKIDAALRNIKKEEFPKNEKGCFGFGRKCEYWSLCKYGSMEGITKREVK